MVEPQHFNPETDCVAHKEMMEKIKTLRFDLQTEIADRKRVNELMVEQNRKRLEDAKHDIQRITAEKTGIMQGKVDLQLELMRKDFDAFAQAMRETVRTFKKTTYVFIGASLTLWGTAVYIIVDLAKRIPH